MRGSLLVQTRTSGTTSGNISINSYLTVFGNAIIRTSSTSNFGGIGVLELHGNLYQYGTGNNYRVTNNFLTIFAGVSSQSIHFDNELQANLGNIIKVNGSDLVFLSSIRSMSAYSDLAIRSENEINVSGLKLNGHTVKMRSNASLSGSLDAGILICALFQILLAFFLAAPARKISAVTQ